MKPTELETVKSIIRLHNVRHYEYYDDIIAQAIEQAGLITGTCESCNVGETIHDVSHYCMSCCNYYVSKWQGKE